jgi:Flp pilus assembly pilin Flp
MISTAFRFLRDNRAVTEIEYALIALEIIASLSAVALRLL